MKNFSKFLAEKLEHQSHNMLSEVLSVVRMVYDMYPDEVMNFLEKMSIKDEKIRNKFLEIKDVYNFKHINQNSIGDLPLNKDKIQLNPSDEKQFSDSENFGEN